LRKRKMAVHIDKLHLVAHPLGGPTRRKDSRNPARGYSMISVMLPRHQPCRDAVALSTRALTHAKFRHSALGSPASRNLSVTVSFRRPPYNKTTPKTLG